MSILVTGGTGKTGRRLQALLQAQNVPCRIATRNADKRPSAIFFDWMQPESWGPALERTSAVYLVAPAAGGETARIMTAFIEQAVARGVRRFVLLSASLLPAGGPGPGQVHQWLQQNASEWAVLRPSWFMQNFSEGQHLATIRDEGAIYSATEDGRVPFISTEDIARAACAALTMRHAPNRDFVLTGPQAISYGDVAAQISLASGCPVVHRRISAPELAAAHRARGLPEAAAEILAAMDLAIASGAEDRVTQDVALLTGAGPIDFGTFAQANAHGWRRNPPHPA